MSLEARSSPSAAVYFAHGRVIDGENHPPIDDGYVLVEDGVIREPPGALPRPRPESMMRAPDSTEEEP